MGSAHGRFQPLHKGHLEYLLAAKERCDFLWVGITQFDVHDLKPSPKDRHREDPANNPLTYDERVEIVTEALMDEGIRRNEFKIIKFPVESPEILNEVLPINIPIFTTVYDDWNRYKIEALRKRGYKVIVLWERKEKVFDGIEVRRLIREGDPKWRELVPPATIRALERYNIQGRLERLIKQSILNKN